jgi:hypothetical protein
MGKAFTIGNSGKTVGQLLPNALLDPTSVENSDAESSFSYKDVFEFTKGKTQVVMKKEDGRPVSSEVKYDPKSPMAKGLFGNKVGLTATGTRYAYEGNHCYVAQTYQKMSDGKELVDYDASVCNSLLSLAKKTSVKHLMECKAAISQMSDVIAKARKRIKEEGKEYQVGMMGPRMDSDNSSLNKDPSIDHDFEAILAPGVCDARRSIWGLEVDPASNSSGYFPYGGGLPVKGTAFGGGMGAGGAFAPGQKSAE